MAHQTAASHREPPWPPSALTSTWHHNGKGRAQQNAMLDKCNSPSMAPRVRKNRRQNVNTPAHTETAHADWWLRCFSQLWGTTRKEQLKTTMNYLESEFGRVKEGTVSVPSSHIFINVTNWMLIFHQVILFFSFTFFEQANVTVFFLWLNVSLGILYIVSVFF